MGRRSSNPAPATEFHIVVKRPGRGPLAPYRFAIATLFAIAVSWSHLWAAAETGIGVDMALGRAGLAGLFAWLLTGKVNSILKAAEPPPQPVEDDRTASDPAPTS